VTKEKRAELSEGRSLEYSSQASNGMPIAPAVPKLLVGNNVSTLSGGI
jgi:hypothetical protein